MHRICSFNMVVKIYRVIHLKTFLRTKFQFSYFGGHFTPHTFLFYLSNIVDLLNCKLNNTRPG